MSGNLLIRGGMNTVNRLTGPPHAQDLVNRLILGHCRHDISLAAIGTSDSRALEKGPNRLIQQDLVPASRSISLYPRSQRKRDYVIHCAAKPRLVRHKKRPTPWLTFLFGADGRTRTGTAFATAPSRQRVYQFHHIGLSDSNAILLLLRFRAPMQAL